jgi:hypothetical protein
MDSTCDEREVEKLMTEAKARAELTYKLHESSYPLQQSQAEMPKAAPRIAASNGKLPEPQHHHTKLVLLCLKETICERHFDFTGN